MNGRIVGKKSATVGSLRNSLSLIILARFNGFYSGCIDSKRFVSDFVSNISSEANYYKNFLYVFHEGNSFGNLYISSCISTLEGEDAYLSFFSVGSSLSFY
jgi:hypothetical protein